MDLDLSKLDKAFKTLEKDLGSGIVIKEEEHSVRKRVVCNSPAINYVTGGGWAVGSIIEIFGALSTGKSLIAMQAGIDFQKVGKFVTYIDVEYSFDFEFAKKIGLDTSPSKFKLIQPNNGEDAFTVAQVVAEAGVGLIIFDSVVGMKPQAEENASYTDNLMGAHARLMGKGLRKLASILHKNETTAIFINQIRDSLSPYSPPVVTPGGKALPFYSAIRIQTKKVEEITVNKEVIGVKTKIEGKKNKTAPQSRVGEISIYFDRGIDTASEYTAFGVKYGIIIRAGAWYTCHNGERFQGMEKVNAYYKENPEVFDELTNLVQVRSSQTRIAVVDDMEEESE